jgi:Zn-dependent protease
MPDISEIALLISVWALPILLAVTLHEAAHAYAARWLGDDTAHVLGRTTLNPLKHIDPVGTILLPGFLVVSGSGFIIGYAKPVPVNFARLKPYRLGVALVALAGPAANILICLAAALALYLLPLFPTETGRWFAQNMENALIMNALLAAFNMLPLPPLDGGRVLMAALPPAYARMLAPLERRGLFIVLGLALILPALTAALGMRFNPVGDWTRAGMDIIVNVVLTVTGFI